MVYQFFDEDALAPPDPTDSRNFRGYDLSVYEAIKTLQKNHDRSSLNAQCVIANPRLAWG